MPPAAPQNPEKPNDTDANAAAELHRAHTYHDDLAKAMNATDAAVVQEMLEQAREKEAQLRLRETQTKERKWYSVSSLLLVLFSLTALAFGYVHYRTLTVPVERSYSVGVFPMTESIVAADTDIRRVVQQITADVSLVEGKPTLVSLVQDSSTLAPLSIEQFFQFIEARASEPFMSAMSSIRLGAMHTGSAIVPFVILSVPDAELATKEFLIAEPQLLDLFYKALGIDIALYQEEVGGSGFESKFISNLPTRLLARPDATTGEARTVLLYGYATDHTIVVTTEPAVLRAIYDTIIKQR